MSSYPGDERDAAELHERHRRPVEPAPEVPLHSCDCDYCGFDDAYAKPEEAPAASRVEPRDEPVLLTEWGKLQAELAALRAKAAQADTRAEQARLFAEQSDLRALVLARERNALEAERDAALARAEQAEQAEAQRDDARRLIQQVEWAGCEPWRDMSCCPWCRAHQDRPDGHYPDCPAFGQQATNPETRPVE